MPNQSRRGSRRLCAARIAIVYGCWAGLWIIASDAIAAWLSIPAAQTVKGLLFIVVTSTVLYTYLRRGFRRQEAAEQALIAASASKTRLVSAVSHDLRQPLQSLALFLGVIDSDPNLSPSSRKAASRLQQSLGHMGNLLNEVLDLARLDIGVVAGKRERVAVNSVLSAVVNEMSPQAEAKGLTIRGVASSAVVDSDATLLISMMRNIVANAIKYPERGGLVIGCRRLEGDPVLWVYDTGLGIDPEKLKMIFEEFYQIDNSARDSRHGLGLGLAIVDRLARMLGHRVVVRSVKGTGSAFGVMVPQKHAASP